MRQQSEEILSRVAELERKIDRLLPGDRVTNIPQWFPNRTWEPALRPQAN